MLHDLPESAERLGKKLAELARLAALEQIVDGDEVRSSNSRLDAIAAMFGLYIADDGGAARTISEVYLWPENLSVWNLFAKCRTQWVTDNGVRTNLNYSGVEVVMRKNRVSRRDEQDVFSKIQAMEDAMLKAWSEKRDG